MALLNRLINKYMKKRIKQNDPVFDIREINKKFGRQRIQKFIKKHNERKRTVLKKSFTERIYKKIFGYDHPRVTANVLLRMKDNFKNEIKT